MKANMSLGAYEITVAECAMADPTWPEYSFQDLVRIAFRDRIITSLDHPVIKRLRGIGVMFGFREIVAADFEFAVSPGERPDPVCLVAREIHSGRRFRLWQDELGRVPPYATGPDVLFVAYYASAELGCYRVLGWPMPERILDLFVEFRARTNGLSTAAGNSLLGALTHFGLDSIGSIEKEDMRALVLRGGPWSGAEREAILDYCESDVSALARLLPVMLPGIDLPRALLRGRYMAAVAAMEHAGVPIDIQTLDTFRRHWTDIQTQLIEEIDVDYGVFEGTHLQD